jgi:hypothetical protein
MMDARITAAFALTSLLMLACSTPAPPTAAVANSVVQLEPLPNPLVIQKDLPLEPPPSPMGRVCKLGTSCLALDERPFEVCLVGGAKRCVDKGVEIIPAQGHESPSPEGTLTISSR